MKRFYSFSLVTAALTITLAACSGTPSASTSSLSDRPDDGSVLPFASAPMGGDVGLSMQESVHKWRVEPRRIPNWVLIY